MSEDGERERERERESRERERERERVKLDLIYIGMCRKHRICGRFNSKECTLRGFAHLLCFGESGHGDRRERAISFRKR